MDLWVTAIVIAFELVQQKSECTWSMIEEKALQWLKTKDLEGNVIQEASVFLSFDLFTMTSIFILKIQVNTLYMCLFR